MVFTFPPHRVLGFGLLHYTCGKITCGADTPGWQGDHDTIWSPLCSGKYEREASKGATKSTGECSYPCSSWKHIALATTAFATYTPHWGSGSLDWKFPVVSVDFKSPGAAVITQGQDTLNGWDAGKEELLKKPVINWYTKLVLEHVNC